MRKIYGISKDEKLNRTEQNKTERYRNGKEFKSDFEPKEDVFNKIYRVENESWASQCSGRERERERERVKRKVPFLFMYGMIYAFRIRIMAYSNSFCVRIFFWLFFFQNVRFKRNRGKMLSVRPLVMY